MSAPRPQEGPGLFEEILGADDRERIPLARPVISWSDDDDPEFLAALGRHARERFELRRRGVFHGSAAELEGPIPPAPSEGELRRRWQAAQPILLPAIARDGLGMYRSELTEHLLLEEDLRRPGGLGRWLRAHADELPAGLVPSPRRTALSEPERDLEKVVLAPADARKPDAPRPMWAKTGRLSNHPNDASLRVRFSFGREGPDDGSRDLARHQLVTDVAEVLLPEAFLVSGDNRLLNLLETLAGEPVFFTQHIAYWNALEGGALFHHDAFGGDEDGGGQLGVAFTQFSGRTLWLALSIGELALRVREFAAYLSEGEMPWVKRELFPRAPDFDGFLRRVNDHTRLMRELALPGCGALAKVVNRGPEFTSLLCDAGHAVVLEPGDVLLLPNHGFARTTMHSVFTASDTTTYALSMAVRASRPRIEPEESSAPDPTRRKKASPDVDS